MPYSDCCKVSGRPPWDAQEACRGNNEPSVLREHEWLGAGINRVPSCLGGRSSRVANKERPILQYGSLVLPSRLGVLARMEWSPAPVTRPDGYGHFDRRRQAGGLSGPGWTGLSRCHLVLPHSFLFSSFTYLIPQLVFIETFL